MYQIIDARSTGKTSRLLKFAKENNCTVVAKNDLFKQHFIDKAYALGIYGLDIITYEELFIGSRMKMGGKFAIDELADFVNYTLDNNLEGYTLSTDN